MGHDICGKDYHKILTQKPQSRCWVLLMLFYRIKSISIIVRITYLDFTIDVFRFGEIK